MPNGPDESSSILAEDIKSLERIVQLYTDGNATKSQAIEHLSVSIATICTQRNITPSISIIHPYLEQLDAYDREMAAAEARSRTVDLRAHGDGDGDGANTRVQDDGGDDQSPSGQANSQNRLDPGRQTAGPARSSDDEHEGEEEHATKKCCVDPSKFNWNDQTKVFFDSLTVTPAHEKVRQQFTDYNVDIKASLRNLETSYGKPSLPRLQWKSVLLDSFVEFNEIFSNSFTIEPDETDLLVVGDTHLEFQKPKVASKIKKASQWNSAW